jgi:hypothetical protein
MLITPISAISIRKARKRTGEAIGERPMEVMLALTLAVINMFSAWLRKRFI